MTHRNTQQVNVYVGPGNGGVSRVFLDSLTALVVWRVTDSELRASNRAQDIQLMLQLQDHLASLGKRVPIIGLRPTEYNSNYARDDWSPGQRTTLSSGPPCALCPHTLWLSYGLCNLVLFGTSYLEQYLTTHFRPSFRTPKVLCHKFGSPLHADYLELIRA